MCPKFNTQILIVLRKVIAALLGLLSFNSEKSSVSTFQFCTRTTLFKAENNNKDSLVGENKLVHVMAKISRITEVDP